MATEEENIIAFVFKRSGQSELNFSKLYLTLSMDLDWFTPEEAKIFVDNAIKAGLLVKKDDLLKPNFNFEEIKVPLGFYPSKDLFKEKRQVKESVEKKDVLQEIISEIVKNTKLDVKDVEVKLNQIAKERNLTPEVAGLLVGKEYDIDLTKFYNDVEATIF